MEWDGGIMMAQRGTGHAFASLLLGDLQNEKYHILVSHSLPIA